MLDRANPRPDRAFGAFRGMSVDGDEGAVLGSLVDRRPQLRFRELRRAGHATSREHRAGPDALDQVRAADEQAPHAFAHLLGAR